MLRSYTLYTFFLLLFSTFLFAQTENSDQAASPEIRMNYQMSSGGFAFASTQSIRKIILKDGQKIIEETNNSTSYLPQEDGSSVTSKSEEVARFTDKEIVSYNGKFTENDQVTTVQAHVNEDRLIMMGRMSEGDLALAQDFKLSEFDFTTAYVTPYFFEGYEKKKVIKNILNLYGPEIRPNHIEFLGKETIEQAGRKFECEKVSFNYEIVKGTMWVAKDEIGYFLVKEEAESEDGPFTMNLVGYTPKTEEKKDGNSDVNFDF